MGKITAFSENYLCGIVIIDIAKNIVVIIESY